MSALAVLAAVTLRQPLWKYQTFKVEGWTLHIREELLKTGASATGTAVKLLRSQLQEIRKVVPRAAVSKLQSVRLWFSPEYPGVSPKAEFHPGSDWLKDHGRDPAMVGGVEFTNIAIFESETRRMPNFALHELAHAYHFRVLVKGFDNSEVAAAFERAKSSGSYDRVERRDANGQASLERAYSMTGPAEYFAESSEAFFCKNDFYPYDRIDLSLHDPTVVAVLRRAWDVPEITVPPPSLKLSPFYKKYFDAAGFPIVSSGKVSDYALKEAGFLVDLMLAKRPDVKSVMVKGGSRMVVIGYREYTTDIPEYKWLEPKDFWDARARGLGGSDTDPVCSCAEENVLGYKGDPYSKECILIHEFAHSIHLRGMARIDPTFDLRVKAAYDSAMSTGLWKGTYAATNHHEYFAEGVQSWFDNNRENDNDHNFVNTRTELVEYDPLLAALCREVFGDTVLKYTKPVMRLQGHLAGYDPKSSPEFVWPARLQQSRQQIKRGAKNPQGEGI